MKLTSWAKVTLGFTLVGRLPDGKHNPPAYIKHITCKISSDVVYLFDDMMVDRSFVELTWILEELHMQEVVMKDAWHLSQLKRHVWGRLTVRSGYITQMCDTSRFGVCVFAKSGTDTGLHWCLGLRMLVCLRYMPHIWLPPKCYHWYSFPLKKKIKNRNVRLSCDKWQTRLSLGFLVLIRFSTVLTQDTSLWACAKALITQTAHTANTAKAIFSYSL